MQILPETSKPPEILMALSLSMPLRKAFVGAALLMVLVTTAAFAQTQTISIRDGLVYLNGQELAEEDVPATLRQSPINLFLSIPEGDVPAFELNGYNYIIRDGRVEEVEVVVPPTNDTAVIFRRQSSGSFRSFSPQVMEASPIEGEQGERRNESYPPNTSPVMEQYVIELQNQADQLQELSSGVPEQQPKDLMAQMEQQPGSMSRFARELAFAEMQSYLSDVETQNQELYQELIRISFEYV